MFITVRKLVFGFMSLIFCAQCMLPGRLHAADIEHDFKTPPLALKSIPLWHLNGKWTTEEIVSQLMASRDIPMMDSIHYYGHGRPGFKLTSSASYSYDRPLTAVEIYGNEVAKMLETMKLGVTVSVVTGTNTLMATCYSHCLACVRHQIQLIDRLGQAFMAKLEKTPVNAKPTDNRQCVRCLFLF